MNKFNLWKYWVKDAFRLFKFYQSRFLLSVIGVTVGISAVCALIAMKSVVEKNSQQFLKKVGESRFVLTLLPTSVTEKKKAETLLTPQNMIAFCAEFLTEYSFVPYQLFNLSLTYHYQNVEAQIIATLPESFSLLQWSIIEGRKIHSLDRMEKLAVVGKEVANQLKILGADNIIGSSISLDGNYFTIIGVVTGEINPLLDFDVNQAVIIDLNLLNRVKGHLVDSFIIQAQNPDLTAAQNTLKMMLNKQYEFTRLHFRDPTFFQKMLFKQVKITLTILTIIASVTLFLGFFSILNVLLILIDERKYEIGLRLSLGATHQHIRNQFLRESILLCSVGGLGGIILGHIMTYVMVSQLALTFYYDCFSWVISLLLAIIIGTIAGFIPSHYAAKLEPVKLFTH